MEGLIEAVEIDRVGNEKSSRCTDGRLRGECKESGGGQREREQDKSKHRAEEMRKDPLAHRWVGVNVGFEISLPLCLSTTGSGQKIPLLGRLSFVCDYRSHLLGLKCCLSAETLN